MHEEILDIKQNIEGIQDSTEQAIVTEYADHLKSLTAKNLDIEEVLESNFFLKYSN